MKRYATDRVLTVRIVFIRLGAFCSAWHILDTVPIVGFELRFHGKMHHRNNRDHIRKHRGGGRNIQNHPEKYQPQWVAPLDQGRCNGWNSPYPWVDRRPWALMHVEASKADPFYPG